MKKTLIAAVLLLGLAAGTQAETTYFTDLSQTTTVNGLTFTLAESGLSTITATDTALLYTANTDNQAAASITFTFDLTAVKAAYADGTINANTNTALVSINYGGANTNNAGIGINNAHTLISVVSDAGAVTGSPQHVEQTATATYTANGREYVTYTLTSNSLAAANDVKGWTAYNASGTQLGQAPGYYSSSEAYRAVDSFFINTDFVTAVAITNYALTDADTIASISANIPEPATATLSLLALAGLATRRRRK